MSYGESDFASDFAWEVYRTEKRRARKPHKCCACGIDIRIGDKYIHVFAAGDGDIFKYDRCLRCEFIFKEIQNRSPYDAISDTLSCGHTWEENFGEPPPPEIARLAFISADEMQSELAELA